MPGELDSKSRIIAAAREEFATHGYGGARTQRIALLAGVNKQLLFYYFGSKRGLYEAVLKDVAGGLDADSKTAAAITGPSAVRERLKARLVRLLENPQAVRLLLAASQGSSPQPVEAVARVVRQLSEDISQAQGVGYFRDDADPDRTAQQLVVLAWGYLALDPTLDSAAASAQQRWVEDAVGLVVTALRW